MIGLQQIDKIGKETFINAGFNKMQDYVIQPDSHLNKELDRVWGENAEAVRQDIKDGNMTDEVKYMLWARLADFQPIAQSEMPLQYVKGGNSRIFYMLKSYTIKQIDVFRREAINKMSTEPKEGLTNLIKLSTGLMVMGATSDVIKDLMFNRPIDLSDKVVDNLLKLIGFSKWQIYKAKSDGLVRTFAESILPPIPFIDDVIKDGVKIVGSPKDIELGKLKTLKGLPLVGKLYYWWFGGGRDLTQKRQPKTRRLLGTRSQLNKRKKLLRRN